MLSKSHIELSHFDIMEDEEDEEKMEVDKDPVIQVLGGHRWLLEQLPALPQFGDVRANVCTSLRKVSSLHLQGSHSNLDSLKNPGI